MCRLAGEPKGKGQKILGSPATTVSHLHFQVNKSIPRDVKVWPDCVSECSAVEGVGGKGEGLIG